MILYLKRNPYTDLFLGEFGDENNFDLKIDSDTHSNLFIESESGIVPKLFEGFDNIPLYKFSKDGKSLIRTDAYEDEFFKKAVRRRRAQEAIQDNVLPAKEFKTLRKALTAIVEALPELKNLPAVQDLLKHNERIESIVSTLPKKSELNKEVAEKLLERKE